MNQKKRTLYLVLLIGCVLQTPALAEEDVAETPRINLRLPPLVITVTRGEQQGFDLPASIDVLDQADLQDGKPQVNVSEVLGRVPGIVVQNRQNYAQDLQISARGFGARTAFGVRGVRLIADGIPASNPDGQGQAATFNLGSAKRIEVLRGPFSAIYGNSSGGVIQIFTADGPEQPTAKAGLWFGSYDSEKSSIDIGGQAGTLNYVLDASRFKTNGYRQHSAATRDHVNGKLESAIGANGKLTVVVNALQQPETQDPLGLTKAQVDADPRQATSGALQFNTRKDITHAQAGVTYEHQLDTNDSLWFLGYGGTRKITQFLAIPVGAQGAPTHPGGVIDFDRFFGGIGARWTHAGALGGAPLTVTFGVDYDTSDEEREGYQNFIGATLGVIGALRRDEDDTVTALNEYVQAQWDLAPQWSISAGVRHTRVTFESDDHYIVGANPDDSGHVRHKNTSPVAGVVYKFTPTTNVYANAGRGFETPTFNELFYKPDGTSGLNFDLKPMKSNNYEVGVKTFIGLDTRVNLALFKIDSEREIVVASSSGGRTTFKNAGDTERAGLELSIDGRVGKDVNAYLAYTYLEARFADSFTTCVSIPCTGAATATVPADNELPGVPRNTLYGELAWSHAPSGFNAALEARWNDQVYVNDLNSEAAHSYIVVNVRAGLKQHYEHWKFSEFVRVDNLLDKKYIGSVIVGDTNSRFYEPAPERNYMMGWRAECAF